MTHRSGAPNFKKIGDEFTRTIEECAEVIQAVTKFQRFGPFETNPETGEQNIEALRREAEQLARTLNELKRRLRQIRS